MDSAIGGAGSASHHSQRFGREAIDPFIRGDGLAGLRIGAERRPVAFLLDFLIGNRAFHDQDERFQLALLGLVPKLQEIIAVFIGENGVVQMNAGQSGDRAQQDVLDAGLRGGCDGNGVTVTTKSGGDPQNMNIWDG